MTNIQITAKIIADSISAAGHRITTFELEYPRFVHAEFMTHRLFSRNAASSRAIPIERMLEQILVSPAMPVEFGKNQSGMQAKESFTGSSVATAEWAWRQASKLCAEAVTILNNLGIHKQLSNRPGEAFQMMKTVMTATEMANFFWLRNHDAAQPEIRVLAEEMLKAYEESEPCLLAPGDWHLPYVELDRSYTDEPLRGVTEVMVDLMVGLGRSPTPQQTILKACNLTLEDAIKISASCCAQVSYRRNDDSLDKALRIYDNLVGSDRKHASVFEHQGTPVREESRYLNDASPESWEDGVTHMGRDGALWSGNLKGWIQNRHLIKDNTCWELPNE